MNMYYWFRARNRNRCQKGTAGGKRIFQKKIPGVQKQENITINDADRFLQ